MDLRTRYIVGPRKQRFNLFNRYVYNWPSASSFDSPNDTHCDDAGVERESSFEAEMMDRYPGVTIYGYDLSVDHVGSLSYFLVFTRANVSIGISGDLKFIKLINMQDELISINMDYHLMTNLTKYVPLRSLTNPVQGIDATNSEPTQL